ncbi:hypothetical protein PaecuDRAFT_0431 [Paenibacillus curdlanolyticus YK9]|uniref:Lipoprotein n=1 Tax=Paenibacillus curdlanolyticus YK9 TaxID=717606 RepID=E0I3Q6_9BACL|nr:hypothetical protein [Paenibacillus curdlanolyticus]EFM12920.1 hypothetical protein PaecuDRAFT_0431 [Paenibacillus curdlanolyticus YK9]
MTKGRWCKSWFISFVWCAAIGGLTGCGDVSGTMEPEKFFSLSVSGLAGKDQYTFQGQSGVVLPAGVRVHALQYRGEISAHSRMKVQLSGDGDGAGGSKGIGLLSTTDEWRAIPRKGADQWTQVPDMKGLGAKSMTGAQTSGKLHSWSEESWAGINPVERLERIRDAAKRVMYDESDNDSGYRVVRIVLDGAAAKKDWSDRIQAEWSKVKGEQPLLAASSHMKSSTWQAAYAEADKQLQAMLRSLTAETTIILKADRRSMLPLHITEQSKLQFMSEGQAREEFYTNEVNFGDY